MNRVMKLKLWLALLLVAGITGTVLAADPAAPATERKNAAIFYVGKVAVIDRAAKAVTIEISGQMYLFQVSPTTRLAQDEKTLSLTELLPGQFVRLSIREGANGTVELLSLEVVPGPEASEETGKGKTKKSNVEAGSKRQGYGPKVPLHVTMPPQVTLPPQVSPYR